MKRPFAALASAFALAALLLLSACGDGATDTGSSAAVDPAPDPEQPTVVSPAGAASGAAVTRSVDAAGAELAAAGMRVSVPAGAVAGARITLQPIEDTLRGSGLGLQVDSDAAWALPLTVSFPVDPSDPNLAGKRLAVQQPDGSWRMLEPVTVDALAGTVSAPLPADTDATTASRRERPLAAPPRLNLKNVILFDGFSLKPASANLTPGGSQTFTPYARVQEKGNVVPCATPADPRAPRPKTCWQTVVNEYPFTNTKPGFVRRWSVNEEGLGNATLGTLDVSGRIGATYTAPASLPNVPVRVNFLSFRDLPMPDVEEALVVSAPVRLFETTAPAYLATVTVKGVNDAGDTFEASGKMNLAYLGPPGGQRTSTLWGYGGTARFSVKSRLNGCNEVSGEVMAEGTLELSVGDNLGYPPNTYSLSFVPIESKSMEAVCPGEPPGSAITPLAFVLWTACDKVGIDPLPHGTDTFTQFAEIQGSKTLKCNDITGTTWTGNWTLTVQ